MFTMFRRAVFGAAIAVMTAAILRVFGGDGAPPQSGGWREIEPADLAPGVLTPRDSNGRDGTSGD